MVVVRLEHPVKCGFYSIFCRLNKHFTECPWGCNLVGQRSLWYELKYLALSYDTHRRTRAEKRAKKLWFSPQRRLRGTIFFALTTRDLLAWGVRCMHNMHIMGMCARVRMKFERFREVRLAPRGSQFEVLAPVFFFAFAATCFIERLVARRWSSSLGRSTPRLHGPRTTYQSSGLGWNEE